jgi:hypothetical protein
MLFICSLNHNWRLRIASLNYVYLSRFSVCTPDTKQQQNKKSLMGDFRYLSFPSGPQKTFFLKIFAEFFLLLPKISLLAVKNYKVKKKLITLSFYLSEQYRNYYKLLYKKTLENRIFNTFMFIFFFASFKPYTIKYFKR